MRAEPRWNTNPTPLATGYERLELQMKTWILADMLQLGKSINNATKAVAAPKYTELFQEDIYHTECHVETLSAKVTKLF